MHLPIYQTQRLSQLYISQSEKKIRIDGAGDGFLEASIFDFTNTTADGAVANSLFQFNGSLTDAQCSSFLFV